MAVPAVQRHLRDLEVDNDALLPEAGTPRHSYCLSGWEFSEELRADTRFDLSAAEIHKANCSLASEAAWVWVWVWVW